ncbi:MAG: hypothetical protein JWO53_1242 [Chlamydiia bacterium]|nr:hypothetical protein [Chlamydiia bacterium]
MIYERLESLSLKTPLSSVEHEEVLKWIRKYMFIGGMPAAVQAYLESGSLLESQKVHHRILQAYHSDFGKYASHGQHKYLQMIFQRAPSLVGQVLKYSHIDTESRSRDLKPALLLLTQAGLLNQIFATTASGLPLHAHIREHRFKLMFLDIGLLQTACQVNAQSFFEKEILQINNGMLAEQFVSQELLTEQPSYQNRPLLFWEGETGGQSEVDFVQNIQSEIIPIEVKAGSTGFLRSLQSFLKQKKSPLGVRISEQNLVFNHPILSVPLYLTHALERLYISINS